MTYRSPCRLPQKQMEVQRGKAGKKDPLYERMLALAGPQKKRSVFSNRPVSRVYMLGARHVL